LQLSNSISPEDLLGQWERIGAAWQTFKTSKELNDLTKLLTELEAKK